MVAIKICGVNNLKLFSELLNRKVDYIGMIFAESKRRMSSASLQECNNLIKNNNCNSKNAKYTAVFLNQTVEEVVEVMNLFPFDILQLHGEETIGYCKKIKKLFPTLQIIKTLSVPVSIIDENLLLQDLQRKISYYRQVANGFLLDTTIGKKRGGTGASFPWDSVVPIVNNQFRSYSVGIAGGLSINNVDQLLCKIKPDFIDVNSGVEIDGEKSVAEIDRLLLKLEAYANESCKTI